MSNFTNLASIRVKNLSFQYNIEKVVFDDVSFLISPREKVAIMGQNGAGKSTLCSIITGAITDFSGDISIPAGVNYVYASQVMEKKFFHWTIQDFLLDARGLRESSREYFLLLELLQYDKSFTNYELRITNGEMPNSSIVETQNFASLREAFAEFLDSQDLPELQVSDECAVELMCKIESITNYELRITNHDAKHFLHQALMFLKKCPNAETVLTLDEFLKRFEIYYDFLVQKSQFQKYAKDHFLTEIMELLGDAQERFEHAGGHEMEREMEEVLKLVGLDQLDKNLRIELLSGGQKSRLILAQSILKKPDILMLDEPTNNLDSASYQRLKTFVKNFEGTLIVISHDADFLNAFVQKVLYIDSFSHKIREYCGTYENVKKEIAEHMDRERSEKAKMDRELKHKKELFQQKSQQASVYSKATSLASAAKKLREEIAEMEKEKTWFKEDRAISPFLIHCEVPDDSLMAIDGIDRWDGEKTEFIRFSYQILKSYLILIAGKNGIGKSHFLKECIEYATMMGLSGTEILPKSTEYCHPRVGGDPAAEREGKDSALSHRQVLNKELLFVLDSSRLAGRERQNGVDDDVLRSLEKKVWFSPQAKIGYYSQDFSTLDFSQTVQESMEQIHPYRYQDMRAILAKFLFLEEHLTQKVGSLSEGQKALLTWARLVFLSPNLLILDEPTNHVNFRHLPIIKEALKKYRGTVVLVCHDQDFICDLPIAQVLDLDTGGRRKWKVK